MKTLFKRPNKQSPYEIFSRACLWEWFTTSGELKPNYKHAMEVGTTMKSNKESMMHWKTTQNFVTHLLSWYEK